MMETTTVEIEPEGTKIAAQANERLPIMTRLSIADGLYLLIVIAGAFIRLTSLNTSPLSPAEATQALAIWQLFEPGQMMSSIDSPAYFTFTSILAAFLGSSDVVMRLVPALFGLGIIALPWLLRRQIGYIGALTAALLFAVSPSLAATSRTAGGEAIALFCLLLIAIAALKLNADSSNKWLYTLAISLGIGMASSPLFYSGLLTLVIARWAQQAVIHDDAKTSWPSREQLIKAAGLTLLTLIFLSTRFFTYPASFGSAVQLFGDWLYQFNLQGDLSGLIEPFLLIGRYELLLVTLGIVAVFWAMWRNNILGTLFTYWLLTTLVLIMLQRDILENSLLIPLTGYILIGVVTNLILTPMQFRWTGIVLAVVVGLGAVILVNVARFLRVSEDQQLLHLWIVFLAFAAVALAFYYWWANHDRAIIQGVWLGMILLLAIFQWGTAWYLTHDGANDPRERWVGQATDDEVPVLIETIEKISQSATNSGTDLRLFSAVDSPVLRWYLREFKQVQIGHTLPPDAQHDAIITHADLLEPSFGSDYLGGDFGLLVYETDAEQLSSTPVTDTLRWWLFHESAAPISEERIILWVRSDLAYNE